MAPIQLNGRRADPLALDLEAVREDLQRFLRTELSGPPRRSGYAVGISGGIDSAAAAALCVEAVGSGNVRAVLLPERESQPEGIELARELVEHLGLRSVEIDLTRTLEALNVYNGREAVIRRLFGGFERDWRYRLVLPGDLRKSHALNVYRVEIVRPDGSRESRRPVARDLRQLQALTNVKQRMRMTCLYREAEAHNLLVCGTTNRTELDLGFFVQYGDGGVDLEPLAPLYKTQVRALAQHLGLPRRILDRPPSPDTWSAPVDDSEFYLRLDYEQLDAVLSRLQRGDSSQSIARSISMDPEVADRVRVEIERRRGATQRKRRMPPVPRFPAPIAEAPERG